MITISKGALQGAFIAPPEIAFAERLVGRRIVFLAFLPSPTQKDDNMHEIGWISADATKEELAMARKADRAKYLRAAR